MKRPTSPSMPDGVSPQERGLPLVKDTSGHTGAHAVSTEPFGAVFSDTMNTVIYAPTAYRPDRIPAQLPSSERSWLKKMGRIRLPWGNTQELAPVRLFHKDSPDRLRIREQVEREDAEQKANGTYKPRITETGDFHHIYDHQRYRFAQLSVGGRFWMNLYAFGKGGGFSYFCQHCSLILSIYRREMSLG